MSRIAGEDIPAGAYLMMGQDGRVRRAENGARMIGVALEELTEGDILRAYHNGWRKKREVQGEVLQGDDVAIQVGRPGNNNREMIHHEWQGEPRHNLLPQPQFERGEFGWYERPLNRDERDQVYGDPVYGGYFGGGKSQFLREMQKAAEANRAAEQRARDAKLKDAINRAAAPVAAKAPVNPLEAQAVMAAVIEVLNFGVPPLELIAHIRLLEQEN